MNFNDVKKMTIVELLNNEAFRDHYVTMYNTCHKSKDGPIFFNREINFLKKLLMDNPILAKVTTLSLFTALLDQAYHGLSIEPISKALAYLVPRGHNIGTKDNQVWEQRALFTISAYGELELRRRSGIIKYIDGPELVFEGDIFEKENVKDANGQSRMEIRHRRRHESSVIIGVWLKITRSDGSYEYKDFDKEQIMSYRAKSKDPNSTAWTGGANGQATRGMWEAKCIRHSFSNYPRLNLGGSTILETDEIEREAAYGAMIAKMSEGSDPADTEPNQYANRQEEEGTDNVIDNAIEPIEDDQHWAERDEQIRNEKGGPTFDF